MVGTGNDGLAPVATLRGHFVANWLVQQSLGHFVDVYPVTTFLALLRGRLVGG